MVKYTYDAWGNTVTEVLDCNANVIAELNPFRYRGYYYDIETELYFLKSRYYDPELGRFMTIDDVSYLDPDTINGLNLYAYCGNNPVLGYDPNGTFNWKKFAIVAGLAITTTAAVVLSGGSALLIAGVVATGSVLSVSAGLETTAVMDASVTLPLPAKLFGLNPGALPKVGVSLVLDFKNMNTELYFHGGASFGVVSPGATYSVGFIENYHNPGDYAGHFINGGVNAGLGIDYCFDPTKPYNNTVKATSITFSSAYSVYGGYDYYVKLF